MVFTGEIFKIGKGVRGDSMGVSTKEFASLKKSMID